MLNEEIELNLTKAKGKVQNPNLRITGRKENISSNRTSKTGDKSLIRAWAANRARKMSSDIGPNSPDVEMPQTPITDGDTPTTPMDLDSLSSPVRSVKKPFVLQPAPPGRFRRSRNYLEDDAEEARNIETPLLENLSLNSRRPRPRPQLLTPTSPLTDFPSHPEKDKETILTLSPKKSEPGGEQELEPNLGEEEDVGEGTEQFKDRLPLHHIFGLAASLFNIPDPLNDGTILLNIKPLGGWYNVDFRVLLEE